MVIFQQMKSHFQNFNVGEKKEDKNMFCTKCGKEIADGQRFCPGCGAENRNVGQQVYGSMNTTNTFDVSSVQNVLPMKWYKFLIYFALIAGAIVNFATGITMVTGSVYEVQSGVSADTVYSMYDGLKTIDVIYGLALFAVAILGFVTRSKLANYKADGPKFVYMVYGISAVVVLLYNIFVGAVTGLNVFNASVVTSFIVQLVMIWANMKYFGKRAHLFVN